MRLKESIEQKSNNEWVIWSSSDFADNGEQIPLVRIVERGSTADDIEYNYENDEFNKKTDDQTDELKVINISKDDTENFDRESVKIARASLKYTKGRSLKDRLERVDKSLNHSDPYLSTEIQRNSIHANKNEKKLSIPDLIKMDPKSARDFFYEWEATEKNKASKDEKKNKQYSVGRRDNLSHTVTQQGLNNLAAQILILNRDEMKAAANISFSTEDYLVEKFTEFTGVDYYTEKVVDEYQYAYILDLLGRSFDKYKDTHVSPSDNDYIMRMKDLTEDLIEKVNLRNNPDNYKK